jgi:hypothetical protein
VWRDSILGLYLYIYIHVYIVYMLYIHTACIHIDIVHDINLGYPMNVSRSIEHIMHFGIDMNDYIYIYTYMYICIYIYMMMNL